METQTGTQFGSTTPQFDPSPTVTPGKIAISAKSCNDTNPFEPSKIAKEDPKVSETLKAKKRAKLIDSIPIKRPFDLNAHIKKEVNREIKRCRDEYALYDELIEKFAVNTWSGFEYSKPIDCWGLTLLQQHAIDDFSVIVSSKGYLCEYKVVDPGFGQKSVLVVTVK